MKMYVVIPIILLMVLLLGCSQNRGQIMTGTGEIVKESTVSKESGPVTESEDFSMDPIAIPGISIGDKHFTLYFDSNSSAEEFFEKIKKEHLVITMKDQGGVEKVGELPWTLTANDEAVTAGPGDILLYQGNRLSICYSETSTNSTKIGHIPYYDDFGDFSEVLGKGNTTVEFTVVWTE